MSDPPSQAVAAWLGGSGVELSPRSHTFDSSLAGQLFANPTRLGVSTGWVLLSWLGEPGQTVWQCCKREPSQSPFSVRRSDSPPSELYGEEEPSCVPKTPTRFLVRPPPGKIVGAVPAQISRHATGENLFHISEANWVCTLDFDEKIANLEEEEIAELLLEKLYDITHEFVFIDENENGEDVNNNESNEPYIDQHGAELKPSEISLQYKKRAVEVNENRKKWKFSTFKQQFSKKWAIVKASEFPGFVFKASHSWLTVFKRRNKIVSRKIQKLVSFREVKDIEQIQNDAEYFRNQIVPMLQNFSPDKIFNTDQTGFRYEMTSTRTLSKKGESYTVQYVISYAGEILDPLFICLQEVDGKFGPRILDTMLLAPNLYVTCTKSGKLNRSKVEEFLDEVLK
ncbi:Tigger transposable element-derived protein 6 [Folsomia candida]|uniref:Tigger transposable element-derived protein 6 n=1 Tax=Folsomia candida TaxID=158441 RepID=A0A226DXD4_FOLCA|nr:Tigger transposable element-derived protein 6 [Folsomia candida]